MLRQLLALCLGMIGLFFLPLAAIAESAAPACEPELAFYKRHADVVAGERDRYIQVVTRKDMQIEYLKQQIEQMKKVKGQPLEKKE